MKEKAQGLPTFRKAPHPATSDFAKRIWSKKKRGQNLAVPLKTVQTSIWQSKKKTQICSLSVVALEGASCSHIDHLLVLGAHLVNHLHNCSKYQKFKNEI